MLISRVCARGVRGDKKKKKRKRKRTGGIPPVILHEIVEGHFGSYTLDGTCTQISWNELGKPSSCMVSLIVVTLCVLLPLS